MSFTHGLQSSLSQHKLLQLEVKGTQENKNKFIKLISPLERSFKIKRFGYDGLL